MYNFYATDNIFQVQVMQNCIINNNYHPIIFFTIVMEQIIKYK